MKIGVFIPSYRRATHKIKTLAHFPDAQIVVSESEYEEYKKNNPSAAFLVCPDAVQGNLCRVLNWILDTANEQHYTAAVIVDDDINSFRQFVGNKSVKMTSDALSEFVENAVQMCVDADIKFFGVNPIGDKGSYREYTPFSFLSYIGGPFRGHILRNNKCRYDETLSLKDDYDMTIQQLAKYRRVLRFNFIHYLADQSLQKGGCSNYRNIPEERRQLDLLVKKWGAEIVRYDQSSKKNFDYNPIIKVPIKGV